MPQAPPSFTSRVLLVAAVVLLGLLAWRLVDLIALMFGAIVAAVALRALAAWLEQRARVPRRLSVLTAVLQIVALLVVVGLVVGQPLGEQVELLRTRLPQAWSQFVVWLGSHRIGVADARLAACGPMLRRA